MAQNPWKKTPDANKPATGGTPPPWMKNKAQQPGSQTTPPSQPPPAFKPPAQTGQSNPPPAFKPPVQASTGPVAGGPPTTAPSGNVPAWMKNKQGGAPQSQPPISKPPGAPTTGGAPPASGSVPPWMKGKQNSPAPTQRKAEDQKQKQQEQAKLKEEQERKKRQEDQKKQARQLKRMQYQQQHSKIRQSQDKVKQSQKKSSKNIKKGSPKKSQIKQSSRSNKKVNSLLTTPFHRYITSLASVCSRDQEYRSKIQNQKQFVESMYKFSEEAKNGIVNYLSQRKLVQRKKSVINLENIIIQYALVEGVSGQPGSAYFKTKSIEILEQKFGYYQVLFNLIVKLLKKSSSLRLRVPLLSKISYKGIQFISEGVCDELLDAIPSPAQNYVQIHGELTQLQKQLKQCGYEHLNRKSLSLKKVTIDNSQFYVIYLSEASISQNLSKIRLSFYPNCNPTFDSLINLGLIASHKVALTYSFMRQFGQLTKNATQKFKITYLNIFQLAHAIRIVYASCQGELQQQTFWNLVFQENSDIWAMVRKAYQGIYGQLKNQQKFKLKNKFMLAKILQLMIPITFGVGKQKLNDEYGSPNQKNKEQTNYCKIPVALNNNSANIICFPLQSLQFYEISQLFDKSIQNPSKIKIAEDSCILQQDFLKISSQSYFRKITVFVNKANLLFQKGFQTKNNELISQAIELMQKYQFAKGKQMQKLIIYPLLMTFYMAAGQNKKKKQQVKKTQQQPQYEAKTVSDRFEKSKLLQSDVKQILIQQKKEDQSKEKSEELEKDQKKLKGQKQENNQNQLAKIKKASEKQEEKVQQIDNETKMLNVFSNLLIYLGQLFEDQQQIWTHAGIYMILASYYSKPRGSISSTKKQKQNLFQTSQDKNAVYFGRQNLAKPKIYSGSQINHPSANENGKKQGMSQSMVHSQNRDDESDKEEQEQLHPFKKQCMKFMELSHKICLQFYGTHNFCMAQFLFHQAQIFYNIKQYEKCQSSIQQALKIYKSSSKHAKNILSCSITLGKSMIRRGQIQNDNKIIEKGIQILQKTAEEMFTLGMDTQGVEVYQFLCSNLQMPSKNTKTKTKMDIQSISDVGKSNKMEQYLEKMAQISMNNRNIESIKQIVRKTVKNELSFYSKQRAISLKQLHQNYNKQNVPEDENENDQIERIQENILFLEEQKQNFGGFLEAIRWSLGILKFKGDSIQWEKATQIMEKVLGLFSEKEVLQLLSL